MWLIGWFIGLLACAGSEGADPAGGASDSGAADSGDPGAAEFVWPAPTWDAAGVAAAFDGVTGTGMPDALTLRAQFTAMFERGDAQCPVTQGYNLTSFTGCMAQSGYYFAGYSVYQDNGPQGFLLASDAYIIDPSGEQLSAAGQTVYQVQGGSVVMAMDGMWGYPPAGGWFGRMPGFNISYRIDAASTVISGGLTMGDGTPGGSRSVYFEDLTWAGGCATGTIQVRDPQGLWYVLAFGEDCSNCAEVLWDGAEIGRACPSFESIDAVAAAVLP